MEHQTILDIMQHKGFGDTWLSWMNPNFSTGTSSVLLYGVPGKTFHCRRGVRQGDPLSPFLFVLAADLLQSLINKSKDDSLLNLPIPMEFSQDFPTVQYADGTLVIMERCHIQLLHLKHLLDDFAVSTGL